MVVYRLENTFEFLHPPLFNVWKYHNQRHLHNKNVVVVSSFNVRQIEKESHDTNSNNSFSRLLVFTGNYRKSDYPLL